jgi:hypothetical protein
VGVYVGLAVAVVTVEGVNVRVGGKRVTVGTIVGVDSSPESEQPVIISMVMRTNDKYFHCMIGLSILQQTPTSLPYR